MKQIYAFMQGSLGQSIFRFVFRIFILSGTNTVCTDNDTKDTIWCKLIKDMDANVNKHYDASLKEESTTQLLSYCMDNMNPITKEFQRNGGSNYYSYPIFLKIIRLLL